MDSAFSLPLVRSISDGPETFIELVHGGAPGVCGKSVNRAGIVTPSC